ncbi:aminopeptidase [Hoeflea sp. TYP-13]|uniref:aminopeptidase n=1 Tax=Hoeflea sp. TYP-13 TaxID=3230023 RepID=UPI0034C6CDEF
MTVTAIFLSAMQGCSSLSYYTQSLNGHISLVSAAKPVDKLLNDPSREQGLREQLKQARDIRQFAIDELALPDNESYRSYVDTGREYVTWAVFAAPEFSLAVHTWCFPAVGCVPYRGYFSEKAAVKFAQGVRTQGFDVYVGGVPAYSTLGWFDDPLLNTMFRRGETYLAGVVFHELSHQRVYVQDDSEFNEAFAVAVEQSGTTAWLRHRSDRAALRRYNAMQKRNDDFLALIAETREELAIIYSSKDSDAQKRVAKAAAIERLRARYRRMKEGRWNGYDGYDHWFSEPINNAKLATVSVYNDLLPAFSNLLVICSGDYERFYKAVERIGKLDKQQRLQALNGANRCE